MENEILSIVVKKFIKTDKRKEYNLPHKIKIGLLKDKTIVNNPTNKRINTNGITKTLLSKNKLGN